MECLDLSFIYIIIFRGVIIVCTTYMNCLQNSKCLCVRHVKFLPHCTVWQKEKLNSVDFDLILSLWSDLVLHISFNRIDDNLEYNSDTNVIYFDRYLSK